jgi:hypothetical protein
MSHTSASRVSNARILKFPPSYWDGVWAAWCPTCKQEAMPLSSGCCGFCGTQLAGQPTREAHDAPLTGPTPSSSGQFINIATAA